MCNLVAVSQVKNGNPEKDAIISIVDDGITQQTMPFSGTCFFSSNDERFFLSFDGAIKDKKERFKNTRSLILSIEGFILLVEENYAGDYETIMAVKNKESLNPCYQILQNLVIGEQKILKMPFVESVVDKYEAEIRDITDRVIELAKHGIYYIKTR